MIRRAAAIAALLALALAASACAPGVRLPVRLIPELKDSKDRFILIYFVGQSHYDVRRAVVLDSLDDEYEVVPEVRDFEYEILQNVSVGESLYESNIFFRNENKITGYVVSEILSVDSTKVLGYEFRPLYRRSFYGQPDILDISYRLIEERKQIVIDIGLKPGLQRPYMR